MGLNIIQKYISMIKINIMFKKMVDSKVKKIVVLGSMHKVEFHEGSIDENMPCNQLSFYGISKKSLRQYLQLVTQNTETVFHWIRGYYIVNKTSKGNSIFAKILQAAEKGKEKFLFTTGVNQYDFLNYDDFCKQIAAITLNFNIFEVINACSGKSESLTSRVMRFIKENNLNLELVYSELTKDWLNEILKKKNM